MKKSTFSESQIIRILKEYETGQKAKDVCRAHSTSEAAFYNWKKKYNGRGYSRCCNKFTYFAIAGAFVLDSVYYPRKRLSELY